MFKSDIVSGSIGRSDDVMKLTALVKDNLLTRPDSVCKALVSWVRYGRERETLTAQQAYISSETSPLPKYKPSHDYTLVHFTYCIISFSVTSGVVR